MLSTRVLENGLWSYDLLRTVSKRIITKPLIDGAFPHGRVVGKSYTCQIGERCWGKPVFLPFGLLPNGP